MPPGRRAHEIDFTIEGTEIQYVEKEQVAFAAPFTEKILAMDLSELNGEFICQKDAFLCPPKAVSIGIAFQKKSRSDSSEARDSSCNGSRVMGCRSCTPEAPSTAWI